MWSCQIIDDRYDDVKGGTLAYLTLDGDLPLSSMDDLLDQG